VCFVDDDQANHGTTLNDLPVMGLAAARERFPRARIVGAIGSPQLRQHLMEKAAAMGFEFATVLHPRIECSRWVDIGAGTVICAGNMLTTNIVLGKHVQINMDCTIGHDVLMGDYATLAPGVHISGYVHLGKRVYVGTGAVFIHGAQDAPLVIGEDVVVGAGACVTRSVPAGLTVVGVPARPLERRETKT
jgi:sugar O-acyltransferase (sialic acid O-acetyltransferase NeuD family)